MKKKKEAHVILNAVLLAAQPSKANILSCIVTASTRTNQYSASTLLKMMNGWGFVGGRAGFPQRFEEQYHCYSVAYADKAHLEVRLFQSFWVF